MLSGTIKHHGTVPIAILCLGVATLVGFFFVASGRLIGPNQPSNSPDLISQGQIISKLENPALTSGGIILTSVDSSSDLMSKPGGSHPPFSPGTTILAHDFEKAQRLYEDRLAHTIETLLERSLGPGKVRAKVNVDLDRSRTTENSEVFDPYGQVVRSSQTSTTGLFTPTGTGVSGGTPPGSSRTEESVNYEITKTIRSNVKEAGGVNRLSVAVLVDGTYNASEDGNKAYEPRPQEEIDQLTRLVKTIVGYDAERGDKVDVINMQFAEGTGTELIDAGEGFMGFTRPEMIRLGETLLLSTMAFLILLFCVRPLANLFLSSPKMTNRMAPSLTAAGVTSTDTPQTTGTTPESAKQESIHAQKNIVGRLNASSVKKVETLIDNNTDQAVSQVRSWLNNG